MAADTVQTEAANESKAGETTRGAHYFTPRVDIYETDNELTLYADVPGVRAGDIDLRFERGELILQGRVSRHEHVGQPLLAEYQEGDFYRVFQIHESIDSTRIEAECKHGVLIVHLPKAEAVRKRQVQVRGE
jgi:HSP20 family molecular chaperone IbpA